MKNKNINKMIDDKFNIIDDMGLDYRNFEPMEDEDVEEPYENPYEGMKLSKDEIVSELDRLMDEYGSDGYVSKGKDSAINIGFYLKSPNKFSSLEEIKDFLEYISKTLLKGYHSTFYISLEENENDGSINFIFRKIEIKKQNGNIYSCITR